LVKILVGFESRARRSSGARTARSTPSRRTR